MASSMNRNLPFSNWSLKKALSTQDSSFDQARVRIIFTILLFSLAKSAIAIMQFATNADKGQLVRAIIAGILYVVLTKILLSRPNKVKPLAHVMLIAGIVVIWTNIFVYSHRVNLATGQFILMAVLSSFYTLGTRLGITYSILAILPALLLYILQDAFGLIKPIHTPDIVPLGIQLIIVLNFISILVTHYLFYVAFHENIVEKERLNKKLEMSITEARQLAAARSEFLSTMSHELRTPLNSVVGMAELLIDDQLTERQRDNLQILHSSAIDLLSLINNVLDFNKIDSHKLELESVPFNLSRFLADLSRGFSKRAEEKRLEFNLLVDDALTDIVVSSDPTRLAQVMYNLLSNALKFTDTGSISVTAKCLQKNEKQVTVSFAVEDTGIGIATERQAAIFDVFTQATRDTSRNYGGSGLGLAIVRQVLLLLGGQIEVESVSGKGSRFYFTITLPLAHAVSPATQIKVDGPGIKHLRILVAEDDKVNRLIIKKQLTRLELDAEIVENGQMAVDALSAKQFDVMLIDLHMPVLDGYETIKQIRQMKGAAGETHIIAFTAAVTEQEKIMNAGFNDFLYKPVQLADLQEKLERAAGKGNTIRL